VVNNATATGQDPAGEDLTDDDSTTTPLDQVSAWEVVKSTTDTPTAAGNTLEYTFAVENTGNVSIGNIVASFDRR